jgi:hypothetical protein
MSKTNPDDTAYPVAESDYSSVAYGMTKREAFVKAAMMGLAANRGNTNVDRHSLGMWAVELAEATIAALNESAATATDGGE